jgi:hypothetical protein
MKPSYFYPLAGHVLVTLAIGFGQIIPGSCIDGLNVLTVGFAASVASTCLAYWLGVRAAARDHRGGLL